MRTKLGWTRLGGVLYVVCSLAYCFSPWLDRFWLVSATLGPMEHLSLAARVASRVFQSDLALRYVGEDVLEGLTNVLVWLAGLVGVVVAVHRFRTGRVIWLICLVAFWICVGCWNIFLLGLRWL